MKKLLPFLALAAIMAVVACSDKKTTNPNPTTSDSTTVWVDDTSGTYWRSTVDGSSGDTWKQFSFSSKDTMPVADDQALTDTTWDIAFRRTIVKINGGVSGSRSLAGVDLASVGSPDSIDFAGVLDTTGIGDDDWQPDSYDYAIDQWFTYNHPLFVLTNYVYTIKDASGKYVKFTVSGMYGGSAPPNTGNLIIRYVYANSGTNISGVGIMDTIEVSSDTAYYDFSTGQQVTPADPSSSLDWDFAIASYDIHLNSDIFGDGQAAAYLNTDSLGTPRTDFDSIAVAEVQPTAYSIDVAGSAFNGWYNYDSGSHSITSNGHVYLIRVGADIYKMQILSYYHKVNDIPASGWYTFKWLKLDL
jgi:hypothetical protein